jgi:hypothetical protein
MGRMKELYERIVYENDGKLPEEMTLADMARMKEIEIYNWEEYEREQEKIRVFRVKQENPREVTKTAQTKEYWENQLTRAETQRIIKSKQ